MCFIEFWRYNSVVQKIKNSFGDTLTCKRPKILIKKMRHTIGPGDFLGCIYLRALWTSSSIKVRVKKVFISSVTTGLTASIHTEVSVCPLEQKYQYVHWSRRYLPAIIPPSHKYLEWSFCLCGLKLFDGRK